MYAVARPLLFALDAERAHGVGLAALEAAYRSGTQALLSPRPRPLPLECLGLRFPNPVGLAAGLDKNAAHIDALAALGFGFIEVGTVTPRPQPGNPRPRMFRLVEHQALVNRLGFNNDGVDALVRNVERARGYRRRGCVLGINIGRNKDTPNAQASDDYVHCLQRVYALADYVTVNISSPNTQGLRDLQSQQALRAFLSTLVEAREQLAGQHRKRTPLLLKIAPDLSGHELDDVAEAVREAAIDGLVCTNTTVARDAVAGHRHAAEPGGLSGAPLLQHATAVLAGMRQRMGPGFPLVGVGGITRGADAVAKRQAGADLVQCYSGLVYRGPALVGECVEALRAAA